MVKFICDNCGEEANGFYNGQNWFKPSKWFSRNVYDANDKVTEVLVCSRECIRQIDEKRGDHKPIIPI